MTALFHGYLHTCKKALAFYPFRPPDFRSVSGNDASVQNTEVMFIMEALRNQFLGKEYPKFSVDVEKGRIAQFARSIGADDPVFFDETAAKHQGYRAIPAPPTFGYTITMDAGQSFNVLEDMGVEKSKAVHGEQGFTYFGDICAGDTITGRQKITDLYDKKNGALIFFVTETKLENQLGDHVVDLHSVIVIRNG